MHNVFNRASFNVISRPSISILKYAVTIHRKNSPRSSRGIGDAVNFYISQIHISRDKRIENQQKTMLLKPVSFFECCILRCFFSVFLIIWFLKGMISLVCLCILEILDVGLRAKLVTKKSGGYSDVFFG